MTSKPISKLWTGGAYPHLTKLPDPPKPSDAMQQLPHISRAYTTLESYFRQQPDVLVVRQRWIDGYRDFSLMRASWVVKRQSTRIASRLR